MSNNSYFDKVYEVTKSIPSGRVTSYGAIANFLALGSARMVGWALNHSHNDSDIPAHRVVNRIGELSGRLQFATPTLMQERLEHEGIKIMADKVVDFKNLFWEPSFINSLNSIIINENTMTANSILDLDGIADKIIKDAVDYPIIFFNGELGAGKTTLIKAICKKLGVIEHTTSPTFSIVNEYLTDSDTTIYHMDLYRLDKLDEALNIGIEEYLDSGNICLIEWPDIIAPLVDEHLLITIERNGDGSRVIGIMGIKV